jgi:purine-binding chemotaxis protein CheW
MSSAPPLASSAPAPFTDAQVVILRVQGGDYAVPIHRVQEIVRVPEITRVPHAQAGVEGVINLRGRVLPVVDLAARLALGTTERARSARVVVVDGGSESIGLLVDGVSEVLRVGSSDVEPPTATTTGDGSCCSISTPPSARRADVDGATDAARGGEALNPTRRRPAHRAGRGRRHPTPDRKRPILCG